MQFNVWIKTKPGITGMNNISHRYDIKMYPTFIHLHGKTFDYKIPASTVMRLFLLPHKVKS